MNSDRIPLCGVGCPIRRSRDQRSLASPPGFSQRATSFIASQCQGIHQMPFVSLDPRSGQRPAPWGQAQTTPGTPPRTGASPVGKPACRKPAAHRGKPGCGSPRRPRRTTARSVSHEDTCPDGPPRRPGRQVAPGQPACPRPVRLGHIRKFVSPVNQHPRNPRTPGNPEAGKPGPGPNPGNPEPATRDRPPAAQTEPNLVLLRMPLIQKFSRFRTPGDGRTLISANRSPPRVSALGRPPSAERGLRCGGEPGWR